MADIRIRYGWAWMLLLAVTFVGAGLMTSDDPTRVRWGIALLLTPLGLTAGLLTVFYLLSRRHVDDEPEA